MPACGRRHPWKAPDGLEGRPKTAARRHRRCGESDSRLPIKGAVYPAIDIDAERGRVPIKDHAGVVLEWVPIARARALLASGTVEILGTRRRIRALRFRQAEPVMERRFFPVRKAGLGAPHRRETQQNPRGCWHLEFLRQSARSYFTKVLDDCRA